MLPKVIKFLLVGLIIILLLGSFLKTNYSSVNQVKYGVSFSPRYARYLNLDWQKTYLQILDELKVKNLRIPSYWDILQPSEDQYDFSETDFMLNEAVKRKAKVILVVGQRQPRWPECHIPKWALELTSKQRQQKTLEFIQKVVDRYSENKSIWAYQVENEPFVSWFGENCDLQDKASLKKEIELVKLLDSKKPIIVTDSGEWGSWIDSIDSADILGISVYRTSYNPELGLYINYPFTSTMYNLKGDIVKKLTRQNKKIIISELQAEPWLSDQDFKENSLLKRSQLFTLDNFKANINFAHKTGFDEAYLWGVEWWYFMEKSGYPQYLDYAKTIF